MHNTVNFYSKILLFGEYALIFGSSALSMPYLKKSGHLDIPASPTAADAHSNRNLRSYLLYLQSLLKEDSLNVAMDVDRLESEINGGLVFRSNIPNGYGLGSSGSLVAAIYHRYAKENTSHTKLLDEDLQQLKQDFAHLESYFHGTSSGLDPLISYLQKAILVKGSQQLKVVDLPESSELENAGLFLIDSGQAGKTQPLVNYFMEQSRQAEYMARILTELIPLNRQSIRAFLAADMKDLLPLTKQLSGFTLQQLFPMVPSSMVDVWKYGLQSDDYYLKLCGSGGGGMLLGFTADLSKAAELLKDYSLRVVFRFGITTNLMGNVF